MIFSKFFEYISLNNVIFINLLLLLLGMIYQFYHNYRFPSSKATFLENNFSQFQQYIDRFYINNIYYVIAFIIIYFIVNCGFILLIRFSSLGITYVVPNVDRFDTDVNTIGVLLFYIFTLVVFFIFYKTIIDILFYNNFKKIHIYLLQFIWYDKLINLFRFDYLTDKIVLMQIFIWYVTTDDIEEECYSSFRPLIEENATILYIAEKTRYLIRKYKTVSYIGQKLHTIFYVYISVYEKFYLFFKIPYIITGFIFSYEFLNRSLHYFYYSLIFTLLVNFTWLFFDFLYRRDPHIDFVFTNYFYKNETQYNKIRKELFYNICLTDQEENQDHFVK